MTVSAPSCRWRLNWLVAIALILTTGFAIEQQASACDDLLVTNKDQKRVAKLIASIMADEHLSKLPLDDAMSQRAFDTFIKSLDPTKAYFLQSDIDEFAGRKQDLDDMLKRGDFSFAINVYKRFIERVDQRVKLAIELVDREYDFSIDEEMITDPDLIEFPANEKEAFEAWRKRIKYNLLVMKDDGSKEESEDEDKGSEANGETKKKKDKVDPKEKLRKRFSSFAKRMHQTDADDIVEMYITAMTSSFDPHTSYMSRSTYENFMIQMELELEGIGATLQATDDGYTVIKSIVPGGACDTQGGIKVEDKIIEVGQGDDSGAQLDVKLAAKNGTDFIDVIGMKLDDVVGMIRGRAGTVVRLRVQSENEDEFHTVEIVREKIKLEDSAARGKVFEEGTNGDGSPRKIGIIDLPSFYADMSGANGGRSTTTDVKRLLNDFNTQGVDALVLDLRRNGGGSLREAIDCTGLFIDVGPVVQVKDSAGQIRKLNDEQAGTAWDKPIVVLTSKFSASASEILAGALQDYGRGIIVGDTTTHGKGTVQSLVDLNQVVYQLRNAPNKYGALKITMQQFYRPNGDSTQKRGVLSDLILPSISDKMDVGESDLDFPVEFDKISRASFPELEMASADMKKTLQQKTNSRIKDSDDFQKQIRRIAHYVEQKNLKRVSLNEEKFLARRKELNAEKEDEKTFEEQIESGKEIERNFYLDEVLRITSDYVDLLNKRS
jgi:carboxyl-terminal processing protease